VTTVADIENKARVIGALPRGILNGPLLSAAESVRTKRRPTRRFNGPTDSGAAIAVGWPLSMAVGRHGGLALDATSM